MIDMTIVGWIRILPSISWSSLVAYSISSIYIDEIDTLHLYAM